MPASLTKPELVAVLVGLGSWGPYCLLGTVHPMGVPNRGTTVHAKPVLYPVGNTDFQSHVPRELRAHRTLAWVGFPCLLVPRIHGVVVRSYRGSFGRGVTRPSPTRLGRGRLDAADRSGSANLCVG